VTWRADALFRCVIRVYSSALTEGTVLQLELLLRMLGMLSVILALVCGQPSGSTRQQFSEGPAHIMWLATTISQTPLPAGGKGTLVEQVVARIKDNPWVAAAIALGTVVIAIASFTDAAKKLVGPLLKNRAEAARVKLAHMSLEFTPDAFVKSAKTGDMHAVRAFLAAGMNPNSRDRGDDTALSYAAGRGDVQMVRALLKAKADISVTDRNKWTGLDRAVQGGEKVMRILLDGSPSPEMVDHAFVMAATYGDVNTLKALVEHRVDLNKVGSEALTDAAFYRRVGPDKLYKNVEYLLELGIDPNSRNEEGWTALLGVAQGSDDNIQLLKVLLSRGADVNARVEGQDSFRRGFTPLLIAVERGNHEIVKALLEAHVDLNARSHQGDSALILAAQSASVRRYEIVDLLLRAGVDVNARNNKSETALMVAETDRGADVVIRLLESGADVNLRDNGGCTALMRMAEHAKPGIVWALLERGADVNVTDIKGQTPLILAAPRRGPACVEILLDRGANIDAQDAMGKTPLMRAAENGSVEVVRLLLTRGADMNKRDRDGRTALQFAEGCSDPRDKTEMVRVLKAAGTR
jgi:ankyrin repeat protein